MIIDRKPELIELENHLERCGECPLGATRTRLVFGRGSEQAAIVLIGEGPGEQEDLQGSPFVGRAGQLLDKIIAAAGLDEGSYYICNIVKCRPPGNRVPAPEEVAACKPFLRKQIALIKPKFLVLLGASAAKTIVGPDLMITRDRGRLVRRGNYILLPTFHPAALLRDPGKKKPVWEDFQLLKSLYDRHMAGETL